MDSAFYSCVDDTIEDTFDASSDTELADSDASVGHTQLDSETAHIDTDKEDSSFDVRNCSKTADWFIDSQQECSSKDDTLQGNSTSNLDGRKIPATGSVRLRQSSAADNKCSLTVGDNLPPNSNLSAADVCHSERSRQRTSQCRGLYVNKSDSVGSRQSSLKSKPVTESARSHFAMSNATLPGSANRLANTMYLPDDRVMEIVEEQLENDDDNDDYTDDDVDDDICVVSTKPALAADDNDELDSDVDDSEVDEVEEISEDDEDRLADEERAVLEEAARAAAEAAASSSLSSTVTDHKSADRLADYPTSTAADASVKKTGPQSASETTCELSLCVYMATESSAFFACLISLHNN